MFEGESSEKAESSGESDDVWYKIDPLNRESKYIPSISDQSHIEELPPFKSFLHCFEEQVQQDLEKIAVNGSTGGDYSYADLSSRVNKVADWLINLDLAPENIVGIYCDQLIDIVTSILAVWKANLAYVLLSVGDKVPSIRLRQIVSDCSPKVILTHQSLRHRYFLGNVLYGKIFDKRGKLVDPQIVYVDEVVGNLSVNKLKLKLKQPEETIDIQSIDPNHLAYIIYSSGSTGKPKGIEIEQRGLYNCMKVHRDFLKITPDDRIVQYADVAFDASLAEIMMALGTGATLVEIPKSARLDEKKLSEFYRQQGITIGILTPSMLNILNPKDFEDLRVIISTGEKLGDHVRNKWCSKDSEGILIKRILINGYGPSEVTICTGMGKCNERGDNTITEMTPELELFVLPIETLKRFNDKSLPQKTDIINDDDILTETDSLHGELVIAAPLNQLTYHGIGRGYHNNSELTQQRFGELLLRKKGEDNAQRYRVFRTCDEVNYTIDSNKRHYTIVGRLDNLIKVRGEMVSAEEVERKLEDNVLQIATIKVIEYGDEVSGFKLLAFYTLKNDNDKVDKKNVEDACRQCLMALEDYKRPDEYIHVSTSEMKDFKLINQNGKRDAGRLREHYESKSEDISNVPDILTKIIKVWQEALKLSSDFQLTLSSNFFVLGGNSLLFVGMQSSLKKVNQHYEELTYSFFLENPTLGALYRFGVERELIKTPLRLLSDHKRKGTPWFLIPGVLGEGTRDFKSFQEHLKMNGNLYTFNARSLESEYPIEGISIEEIARDYVKCLRVELKNLLGKQLIEHHDLKHIVLIGYSSGCTIAYEMAAQLQIEQKKVLLILLDGLSPMLLRNMTSEQHAKYLQHFDLYSYLATLIGTQANTNKEKLFDPSFGQLSKSNQIKKMMTQLKADKYFGTHNKNSQSSLRASTISSPDELNLERILKTTEAIALAVLNYQPKYWVENTFLILAGETVKFLKPFINSSAAANSTIDTEYMGWLLSSSQNVKNLPGLSHHEILQGNITGFKAELMPQITQQLQYFHLNNFVFYIKKLYQERYGYIELFFDKNGRLPIEHCFINLMLIKEEKLKKREMSEFNEQESKNHSRDDRLMSYENLYQDRDNEAIEIRDIFKTKKGSNKSVRKVLIYGRSGIGKTTLCRYIANQCSQDKLWKNQFKLVLWIQLRELNKLKKLDSWQKIIKEVFKNRYKDNVLDFAAVCQFMDDSPDQVLLIFDGFDELSNPEALVVFNHLLEEDKTPYIIATTRPTVSLNEKFDRILETTGFNSDNVVTYVNQFFSQDRLKAWQFNKIIQENANLLSLAHIPINLELMCSIFDEKNAKFQFKTMTELYQEIEQSIWYRKSVSSAIGLSKPSLTLNKKNEISTFLQKLAFDAICKHKILLGRDDILNAALISFKENIESYYDVEFNFMNEILQSGFLYAAEKNIHSRNQQFYFLHSIFLEYFAAKYIATCLSSETEENKKRSCKFIRKNKYDQRLQNVLWTTVGLIHKNVRALNLFFEVFFDIPRDLIGDYEAFFLFRCLEEGNGLRKLNQKTLAIIWEKAKEICARVLYTYEYDLKYLNQRSGIIDYLSNSIHIFQDGKITSLFKNAIDNKNNFRAQKKSLFICKEILKYCDCNIQHEMISFIEKLYLSLNEHAYETTIRDFIVVLYTYPMYLTKAGLTNVLSELVWIGKRDEPNYCFLTKGFETILKKLDRTNNSKYLIHISKIIDYEDDLRIAGIIKQLLAKTQLGSLSSTQSSYSDQDYIDSYLCLLKQNDFITKQTITKLTNVFNKMLKFSNNMSKLFFITRNIIDTDDEMLRYILMLVLIDTGNVKLIDNENLFREMFYKLIESSISDIDGWLGFQYGFYLRNVLNELSFDQIDIVIPVLLDFLNKEERVIAKAFLVFLLIKGATADLLNKNEVVVINTINLSIQCTEEKALVAIFACLPQLSEKAASFLCERLIFWLIELLNHYTSQKSNNQRTYFVVMSTCIEKLSENSFCESGLLRKLLHAIIANIKILKEGNANNLIQSIEKMKNKLTPDDAKFIVKNLIPIIFQDSKKTHNDSSYCYELVAVTKTYIELINNVYDLKKYAKKLCDMINETNPSSASHVIYIIISISKNFDHSLLSKIVTKLMSVIKIKKIARSNIMRISAFLANIENDKSYFINNVFLPLLESNMRKSLSDRLMIDLLSSFSLTQILKYNELFKYAIYQKVAWLAARKENSIIFLDSNKIYFGKNGFQKYILADINFIEFIHFRFQSFTPNPTPTFDYVLKSSVSLSLNIRDGHNTCFKGVPKSIEKLSLFDLSLFNIYSDDALLAHHNELVLKLFNFCLVLSNDNIQEFNEILSEYNVLKEIFYQSKTLVKRLLFSIISKMIYLKINLDEFKILKDDLLALISNDSYIIFYDKFHLWPVAILMNQAHFFDPLTSLVSYTILGRFNTSFCAYYLLILSSIDHVETNNLLAKFTDEVIAYCLEDKKMNSFPFDEDQIFILLLAYAYTRPLATDELFIKFRRLEKNLFDKLLLSLNLCSKSMETHIAISLYNYIFYILNDEPQQVRSDTIKNAYYNLSLLYFKRALMNVLLTEKNDDFNKANQYFLKTCEFKSAEPMILCDYAYFLIHLVSSGIKIDGKTANELYADAVTLLQSAINCDGNTSVYRTAFYQGLIADVFDKYIENNINEIVFSPICYAYFLLVKIQIENNNILQAEQTLEKFDNYFQLHNISTENSTHDNLFDEENLVTGGFINIDFYLLKSAYSMFFKSCNTSHKFSRFVNTQMDFFKQKQLNLDIKLKKNTIITDDQAIERYKMIHRYNEHRSLMFFGSNRHMMNLESSSSNINIEKPIDNLGILN